MKHLLISIIAICLSAVLLQSCQPTPYITGEAKMQLIDTPSQNKTELFIRSMEWVNRHFESSKSVINFHDKEEGIILGRFLLKSVNGYSIYATIKIATKNDAVRVLIEPISAWPYEPTYSAFKYSANACAKDIDALIANFAHYVQNPEKL